jgi:hypothetical protein
MAVDTEEWESNPSGMMAFYQNQPYKLGDSIADLIDNAYDADATKIDVRVGFDKDNDKIFIRILDNGKGISEDNWSSAMMLGFQKKRGDLDLGLFGVGLKLSALSQANEVTVASINNRKFGVRRISSQHIINSNKNELLLTNTDSYAYHQGRDKMIEESWSTMVLLEDIHASRRFSSEDMSEDAALQKEINRIKIHLSMTFEKAMKSKTRGHVELKFQGKILQSLDPMMKWENNGKYGTVVIPTFTIDANIKDRIIPVRVTPVIIPHTKNYDDGSQCRKVHSGYKKANEMQGLYIYRNDRLIQYGSWCGMYGTTNEEHNKLGKIAIHVPSGFEKEFGLSPTKTDIHLPLDFIRLLRAEMDKKRQWGQIKNGTKMSFSDAFDKRYRGEGKLKQNANKKTREKFNPVDEPSQKTKKESKEEKAPDEPIFDPSRKNKKIIKHQPIVKSIENKGGDTIVVLDNSKEGYNDLIQIIRKWLIG